MTHSYQEIWAVKGGGGARNLRRHSSPNENLAQTSHGRGAGLQPYKFTGKELETTHGQCLYDFGARWLDPLLPRWTSTDPLAEAYYHVSPYAYCAGNPVSFVDPDGMGINDVNELEGATIVGERKKRYVMDKSWYEWKKNNQREQEQTSKISDDNEPGSSGRIRYYRDKNGKICGEIQEVVVRPSKGTSSLKGTAVKLLQNMLFWGSGAVLFFEHNNYSRIFNHWRGKNGKLYSGLTGKGPNQHTGSRSLAMEKAMKFDKAGKVLGIVGTGYSAYEAYNAEGLKRFEYGLNAVMGAAGFIPEVGPFISLYWGVGGKQLYWM